MNTTKGSILHGKNVSLTPVLQVNKTRVLSDSFKRLSLREQYKQGSLWLPENGNLEYLKDDCNNCSCSAISANVFMNFAWVGVNCMKQMSNIGFICEHKRKMRHLRVPTSKLNVTYHINCGTYGIAIDMYCVRILKRFQLLHDLLAVRTVLKHPIYLSSWTLPHIKGELELYNHSLHIHAIEKQTTTCLSTSSPFFVALKVWRHSSETCPSMESVPYFLHISNLITTPISVCTNNHHAMCSDNTCIMNHHLCDNVYDCPDESDERNCNNFAKYSSATEVINCLKQSLFQCIDSGRCIELSLVCNTISDCNDSSDEHNQCFLYSRIYMDYQLHQHPCPDGWSLCASSDNYCYPNSDICIHTKTMLGLSLYCPKTEHLRHCGEHTCPESFKVSQCM